ncbi:MAG: rRNA maturation RNase YbeY [Bacilli bacterium]
MLEIVTRVCAGISSREELAPAEVSITVVDEGAMRALNRQYRGLDAPTDVLSFALLEAEGEPPGAEDDPVQILGDIVISWPTLRSQAQAYGHSAERELAFLAAHGFYHLLGYDHQTAETELAMQLLQETVLSALGYLR